VTQITLPLHRFYHVRLPKQMPHTVVVGVPELVHIPDLHLFFLSEFSFCWSFDYPSFEDGLYFGEEGFVCNYRLEGLGLWVDPWLIPLELSPILVVPEIQLKVQLAEVRALPSNPLLDQMVHLIGVAKNVKVHVCEGLSTLSAHSPFWKGTNCTVEVCVLGSHVELMGSHHKLLVPLSLMKLFLEFLLPLVHVIVIEARHLIWDSPMGLPNLQCPRLWVHKSKIGDPRHILQLEVIFHGEGVVFLLYVALGLSAIKLDPIRAVARLLHKPVQVNGFRHVWNFS